MPVQEFLFPSHEQASQYVGALLKGSRRSYLGGHTSFRRHALGAAGKFGGTTYFSSHRKELISHLRQHTIFAQDRRYLYERDPLARKIVDEPAQDAWLYPPTLGISSFDDWLEEQWYDKGFGMAAESAHIAQRRDGFGLILINTDGSDPSQPLAGRETVLSYQHVTIDDLAHTKDTIVPDETQDTERYPHGIAQLNLDLFDEGGNQTGSLTIDGSRLIMPPSDPQSRTWWATPVLDRVYDNLWDLADAVSASTKNVEQGNPVLISVETDPNTLTSFTQLDDEEIDSQMDAIAKGDSDYIGPVKGLTVRRLGKNDVVDPDATIRLLASRISNGCEFRVNEILASSRGSEQVTPEDSHIYRDAVHKLRIRTVYRTVRQLITLGKRHFGLPRRPDFRVGGVRWPHLRTLDPKEEIFVEDRQAGILGKAAQAGRRPPEYIDKRWPEGDEVDEDKVLPRISVTRRDEEPGGSPAPRPPGGANATFHPNDSRLEEAVRSIMEDIEHEKEMLQRDEQ